MNKKRAEVAASRHCTMLHQDGKTMSRYIFKKCIFTIILSYIHSANGLTITVPVETSVAHCVCVFAAVYRGRL